MKFDKRLEKLESVTPNKKLMKGLGEYYAWMKTPEGQKELDKFYNPDRHENSK